MGDTPGFGGDVEAALRSIRVPVLYMPSETDLYFPIADAQYERQFLERVDNAFLNASIQRFLK